MLRKAGYEPCARLCRQLLGLLLLVRWADRDPFVLELGLAVSLAQGMRRGFCRCLRGLLNNRPRGPLMTVELPLWAGCGGEQ